MIQSNWPTEWYREVAENIKTSLKLNDQEVIEFENAAKAYDDGVTDDTNISDYDERFVAGVLGSQTLSDRVRYATLLFITGIWVQNLEPEVLWKRTIEYLKLFFSSKA